MPLTAESLRALEQFKGNHSETYESGISYNTAQDKKVDLSDILQIRRLSVWSFWHPYDVELIVIHDASNVTAHVNDSIVSSLYFNKHNETWDCEIRRGHKSGR